jgi:hypothetical protein
MAEIFDSYLGVWVVPMHALDMTIQIPGETLTEVSLVHAEADSTWKLDAITEPDFDTGGVRIVGFVCDITFIPPYNDFDAFWQTFRAIVSGEVLTVNLSLSAPVEQPKGASTYVGDDANYAVKGWSAFFRTNNQTEKSRLEFVLHGTFSTDLFRYFNSLLTRGYFFGAIEPN